MEHEKGPFDMAQDRPFDALKTGPPVRPESFDPPFVLSVSKENGGLRTGLSKPVVSSSNPDERKQGHPMSFWVYLLRCADGSYYVGHTDHLEKRMAEHTMGTIPGYTLSRRPVTLAFSEEFPTREEALERERQIKRWNRSKKEALIRSDWVELSRLAKGVHPSPRQPR